MSSASTTDFSAVPSVPRADSTSHARTRLSARNFYIGLALFTLVVAALSLLIPSTPSYDPWSWILWGREIIHLRLKITTGGTSWKPLPMIFTIPFALFGRAAPDLWLVVARAGALAAVIMAFRLAFQLTRQVAVAALHAAEPAGGWATLAPALLAGLVAAVGIALSASGDFVSSNVLGYSEGFATALLLITIERAWAGEHRQAFLVGFFVALDRPETWLFWGPYGLWLFWRDPGARILVATCFVLIPVLWFLPVYLASGQLGSSVTRAEHPRSNSLAFASNPFEAELKDAAWPTMLLRVKVLAALVVIGAATLLYRPGRGRRLEALREPRTRALTVAALLGLGGLAWFVVIAAMTQVGFSGNNRYLVIGSALIDICGGVGFGWLALLVARGAAALLDRRRGTTDGAEAGAGADATAGARIDSDAAARERASARGKAGMRPRSALVTGVVVATLVFLFAPNWIGPGLISIPRTHGSLVYQANLRKGLTALVDRFGGRRRVLACGTVMTEGFQVPMVAWTLDVHTTGVGAPPAPGDEPGPAPNVILQTRDTRSATLLPYLSDWPNVHYHYVGTSGPVHMFTHCASPAT